MHCTIKCNLEHRSPTAKKNHLHFGVRLRLKHRLLSEFQFLLGSIRCSRGGTNRRRKSSLELDHLVHRSPTTWKPLANSDNKLNNSDNMGSAVFAEPKKSQLITISVSSGCLLFILVPRVSPMAHPAHRPWHPPEWGGTPIYVVDTGFCWDCDMQMCHSLTQV